MPKIRRGNLRQQVVVERKRRNATLLTLILIAFVYISYALLFGDMGLIKYRQLEKTRERLTAEIKNLEHENRSLKSQVNALKIDPFYIEKHAREEFGLAMPDEYIFHFHDR